MGSHSTKMKIFPRISLGLHFANVLYNNGQKKREKTPHFHEPEFIVARPQVSYKNSKDQATIFYDLKLKKFLSQDNTAIQEFFFKV